MEADNGSNRAITHRVPSLDSLLLELPMMMALYFSFLRMMTCTNPKITLHWAPNRDGMIEVLLNVDVDQICRTYMMVHSAREISR